MLTFWKRQERKEMNKMKEISAIEESHICLEGEEGKGYLMGDPITCTDPFSSNPGEIFRFCQKEYGKCTSSIYVDAKKGVKRIGWVFRRKEKYTDCDKWYIHEVWITLLEKEDTVIRKQHFFDLGRRI